VFVVPCFAWGYPRASMSEITTILDRAAEGEAQAAHELLPLVYEELRKLAATRMANEWDTSTLQPTALVHDAWLRLVGSEQPNWKNRGHFFAAAAEAMRRILIDRARRKQSLKRGARAERLDLDRVDVAIQADEESLLAMNDALEKLVVEDPHSAELVKLRFFVGLNYQEAAQALGISERSAKRCWAFARAWLYRELSQIPPK
jgi:RNA polymerase sigma factor (TIGR02999 family)